MSMVAQTLTEFHNVILQETKLPKFEKSSGTTWLGRNDMKS